VLSWIPLVYMLAVMAYAGFLDVRSREIPPRYWFVVLVLGLPITIIANGGDLRILLLYQLLSLIVVIPSYLMYRACMLGGADVLAFLTIAILTPLAPGSIIPLLYLAVLYATIPAIAYHLYSASLACKGLSPRCMFKFKFMIKVRSILEDPRFKWWLVEVKGGCNIEEDPRMLALKAGQGDPEAYVVASPGHPYVAHLTIGYLLAMVIGDKPVIGLVLALAQFL